jgi:hypothetical protein
MSRNNTDRDKIDALNNTRSEARKEVKICRGALPRLILDEAGRGGKCRLDK